MQTSNPQRPEPRRKSPAITGGLVHIPGNNERQLLARIDQLEAAHDALLTAAVRLSDRGFFLPTDCADRATALDMAAMRAALRASLDLTTQGAFKPFQPRNLGNVVDLQVKAGAAS